MGRYEHEFVTMFVGLEKQLDSIDNPRHRTILKNYRRHGPLEVAGRYEELLAPDMTVEHPQYRLHEGGQSIVLDGMEQVVLPISWVDPVDISNAVVWLASDEARYVTGIALPVDGGITAPFTLPHVTG